MAAGDAANPGGVEPGSSLELPLDPLDLLLHRGRPVAPVVDLDHGPAPHCTRLEHRLVHAADQCEDHVELPFERREHWIEADPHSLLLARDPYRGGDEARDA